MRAVVVLAALAACYDVPSPECGFQCGPDNECPEGYECLGDRCRLQNDRSFSCPAIETPDITRPPDITATDPRNNETDVELDRIILVTFDENVVDVNAQTFRVDRIDPPQGQVPGTVSPVGAGARAFQFTPDRLDKNATYRVTLSSSIRDIDHLPLFRTSWVFSTELDDLGPRIISSIPADHATNVSLAPQITVMFDEPISQFIMSGSMRLQIGQTVVPTALGLNGSSVMLMPQSSLHENTTYSIVITDAIRDIYDNPATPAVLTFDTHDTIPPMIVALDPMPGATNVPSGPFATEIFIIFNEDVVATAHRFHLTSAAGDVPFVFSYDPQMFVADLSPNSLEPATTYTVSFDEMTDRAGNPATFPSYTFTTAP